MRLLILSLLLVACAPNPESKTVIEYVQITPTPEEVQPEPSPSIPTVSSCASPRIINLNHHRKLRMRFAGPGEYLLLIKVQ